MAIEAEHYQTTRDALMADPIIQQMGQEIVEALDNGHLTHANLHEFGFMNSTLREYTRRGGQIPTHIGGPAEAIRALIPA